jgi:hypothetical protein
VRSLFRLSRHEEAEREATRLVDEPWPVRKGGGWAREPSPFRQEMQYVLGKIAHVRGDYDRAVSRYGEVKDAFPDARQAWLFFTERGVRTPATLSFTSEGEAAVPVSAKNVDGLRLKIYAVDIPVLFAVKKSVEKVNEADLTGITPLKEWDAELPSKKYAWNETRLPLPPLEAGGYLLVASAKLPSLGTAPIEVRSVVVRSDLMLLIQRSEGMMRAYVTDEKSGKPVAGAKVRIGTGQTVLPETRTDERGIAVIHAPNEPVTAIAEWKGSYALAKE